MSQKTKETAEGVLRHDIDEGWILGGEGPNSGSRICDLFPALDGRRVRVTVEVIPDPCKKCNGTGRVGLADNVFRCETCKGSGLEGARQ